MSEPDDNETDRRNTEGQQRRPDERESDRGDGKDQRRRSDERETDSGSDQDRRRRSADGGKKKPLSPARLARRASDELAELLGREIEGVVSLRRDDEGWCVGIEVLEIARVPDTADVLAEYEVLTDRRGRLRGYYRVRRYTRASTQVEK